MRPPAREGVHQLAFDAAVAGGEGQEAGTAGQGGVDGGEGMFGWEEGEERNFVEERGEVLGSNGTDEAHDGEDGRFEEGGEDGVKEIEFLLLGEGLDDDAFDRPFKQAEI